MSITTEALAFLEALARNAPPDERLIFCGFPGDPNNAPPRAWRPMPYRVGEPLPIRPDRTNGYVSVSSFKRSPDKTWRRRTDQFGSGLAVMVDDVGTKVDYSVVENGLDPSIIIETSPENFQYWYLIQPCHDKVIFDAVIKAFIAQQLLGDDPGMNGVNRVGRVPGFINGKGKYNGWRVCTTAFEDHVYTLEDIREGFGLKLDPVRRKRRRGPPDAEYRVKLFMVFYNWLKAHGMLKHERPNAGGWIEMRCPWVDEHTGRANTGAAISMPNPENEWYGGYQCHHGHCIDRGWAELTDWIADFCATNLESIR